MRKDHYCAPVKWTREYRQALKLGDRHFKVYAYLEGGPESHATGIYFVTPGTIAEMVRETRDTVVVVLGELAQAGMIRWDPAADVVLVPVVCAEQFRWSGRPHKSTDNRVVEARHHLAALPPTPLLAEFIARWPVFRAPEEGAFEGACQGASEGASKGLAKGPLPVTSPSSPLTAPGGPPDTERARLDAPSEAPADALFAAVMGHQPARQRGVK